MTARDDELLKRLDELCNSSNTDVIAEIQGFEEKHSTRFGREYGRFCSQYEQEYADLLMRVMETHTSNPTWQIMANSKV
jgi:hypothetical protein